MAIRIQLESVTETVKQRLRQMILEGDLEPGSKILQDQIAEELGVSKTPILKALHVLETENLVESIPRRGFFVREFTIAEIADVFAVREVVEGVAAEEAASFMGDEDIQRLAMMFAPFHPPLNEEETKAYRAADQDFHNLIVSACRNEFVQQINSMVNVLPISYRPGLLRSPAETLPEHQEMVRAIRERDPVRARRVAMDHLYRTRVWLHSQLEIEEKIPNR